MLSHLLSQVLSPLVFNTVKARAEELGGSALMLTEWGTCWPDVTQPDSQGAIIQYRHRDAEWFMAFRDH